jgi:lipopolysaccharide transport system permease protein
VNKPSKLEDITVIEPSRRLKGLAFGELRAHRDLLYFLTWRDIKIRYKQTVIGAAWAVIQPLFTMVVFTLFFGRLANVPSDGLPYPIFSYTALLPWTFFAEGMKRASDSLVGSANLLSKVYFPRLIIPLAAVLAGLVDFAIAFVILIGMIIYYRVPLTWNALWFVAFLLLALVTALGAGLWLAALNVTYRDVRYTVTFLTQLWMYATPVIYPASLLHGTWRLLLGLNPMTGVVEGFRWALLGNGSPPNEIFAVSVLVALILLVSGVLFFRRMERTFADVV